MARGLKISHKRADNTLVDQEVFDPQVSGSTIGSTGGRPQLQQFVHWQLVQVQQLVHPEAAQAQWPLLVTTQAMQHFM